MWDIPSDWLLVKYICISNKINPKVMSGNLVLILARHGGQPDDAGNFLQDGHLLQSSSLQDLEG